MARLFMDSFDHYDTAHVLDKWNAVPSGSGFGIVSNYAGATNNCLQLAYNGFNGTYTQLNRNFSNIGTVIVGLRFACTELPIVGYTEICRLQNSGVTQVVLAVNPVGAVSAWVGNGAGPNVFQGGTLLGASANGLITSSTMAFIEASVVIAPTSGGSITVNVNGAQVFTVSTVTTSYDGSSIFNQLGILSPLLGTSSNYYDDIYVNTTGGSTNTGFDGDQRIVWLPATGAGGLYQWTNNTTGTATTANFNGVTTTTPLPDDDTTYNSAPSAPLTDLYTIPALNASLTVIKCVQSVIVCRTDDGGSATLASVFSPDGSTVNVGTAQPVQSTYNALLQCYGTNPDTSNPWHQADFATTQIGMKRVS